MNETKRKIWHNKEDMPLAKEKILAFNEYGDAKINYAINMALYWPKVIKWAYISDLHSFIHSIEVPEKDDGINNLSSDLEEAAKDYARKQLANPDYPTYNDEYEIECAFEAGAKWQEEQSIRAVEIAREEVIEKAQDWIADTFKYDGSEDFNGGADDAMSMLLDEFTKYMERE